MSPERDFATGRDARKRRRLNPRKELSSQDEDDVSDDVSLNRQYSENESHSPTEKFSRERSEPQKSRHRIHIVKNTSLIEDEFFSQIPESSQSLHHLRGAYWHGQRPASPPPRANVVSPQGNPEASTKTKPLPCSNDISSQLSTSNAVDAASKPAEQHPDGSTTLSNGPSSNIGDESALLDELADFPLDILSSPADSLIPDSNSSAQPGVQMAGLSISYTRLAAPQTNLRQTTLFGGQVGSNDSGSQGTQSNRVHNWPVANRNEAPTHHELNEEELQSWIYPTNLGAIRDYQYNIVSRGLYHNVLVALPTGLGKTFIAATIMLNWFRWTKSAQIVFVAPTRPLVAQQVNACFNIAGIPRSATSLLTGNVSPALRALEWSEKRIFFMTPQTIVNDLKSGICDPKRIVLVVVDEAHRATGNYAYVEVVRFLRRFNNSFRVLALTATPGSTVDSVQQVIDGLGISRTEIRTEESIDIRQYVHQRNIDTMLFDYDEDAQFVMDLLSNAIKPVLQTVNSMNVYWSKDPMTLTPFGCTQALQKWAASPAGRGAHNGLKWMVRSIMTTLASLAHAIDLLKFHGIVPFYNTVRAFQSDDADGKGKGKGGKYKNQIVQHQDFKTMMSTVRQWTSKEDFLGHAKLEYLSQVALNHFIDAGEGRGIEAETSPSATRIMIFAHFRDSAEEIVRVLKRHSPMVRPHVFVGQASSKGSEGMDQKKQQSIIDDFKKGVYNTLVATSIGEEGLDIGQVDLIICYDASASPIRMLQRMGRTGRKRAGNIVVLLMKKKEQENFEKAKDNYEKMQKMIADGSWFQYHDGLSPRIVPKGVNPQVDKRIVEIPLENSQADGELPEPKKKGRMPKRPPKKFHMPDGVITGFLKASELEGEGVVSKRSRKARARSLTPEPLPNVESVFLTASQEADLENKYLDVGGDEVQVVEHPRLNRFTDLQRQERPSKLVGHGSVTWRTIELLNTMHDMDEDFLRRLQANLDPGDRDQAESALQGNVCPSDARILAEDLITQAVGSNSSRKRTARKKPKRQALKSKPSPPRRAQSSFEQPLSELMSSAPGTGAANGTEDEGIDLMNTDDEHEFDDENDDENDGGSDLLDFIDDDTPVEHSSSLSSPPGSIQRRKKMAQGLDAGSARSLIAASAEASDAELPHVDDLLGPVHPSSTDSPHTRRRPRGKGRTIVVDDSDSE